MFRSARVTEARSRTLRIRLVAGIALAFTLHTPPVETGEAGAEFTVALTRTTGSTPVLLARLSSSRVFPCTGYRIRTRTTRERDTLTVHILGFLRPSPCAGGFAEADGEASLGNIAAGRYHLRIASDGRSDLYRLTLTRGIPEAAPLRTTFTTMARTHK